jgi:hypothetical protein
VFQNTDVDPDLLNRVPVIVSVMVYSYNFSRN